MRSITSLDRSAGSAFLDLFFAFHVVDNRRARSTLTLYGFAFKVTMAFSEMKLKRIERVVGALCQRRSPAHLKDKLRLSYSVKNHEVLIHEARPDWHNPSEWIESSVAKLRYVRASDEWRLYWKRASGKWWLYEPHSPSKSLSSMVKEIDIDSDGCFFG